MSNLSELKTQFANVRAAISQTCKMIGRNPLDIELLAVSKAQPLELIAAAMHECEQTRFAENYLQELSAKKTAINTAAITWHFIGQLQSNKIKKIASVADVIHSLAKLDHARLLDRYCSEIKREAYPVYIAVKTDPSVEKAGIVPEKAFDFYRELLHQAPRLRVLGIMSVPPPQYQDLNGDATEVPQLYLDLRKLADRIGEGRLSLGMSHDMHIAIKAGSTCLRIGEALFGPRGY